MLFDNETSTQPIADKLKAIIHDAPPRGRRAAMESLQAFERCGWNARAFDEAQAGRLAVDENGALIYAGDDPIIGITDTLNRYLAMVGCVPSTFPDPMGIEDAARYLKLTVDGVKKHVHRIGDLVPMKQGHTLLFTKALLDEFQKNKRKVGRPSHKTEE